MPAIDMPAIDVHFIPDTCDPGRLTDCVAVVIDVLRATTTIAVALQSGASAVRTCVDIQQALQWRASDPRVLLGGERGGVRIDGFDLGNSPAEYAAEAVAGRLLVMTTTNGTRAIDHCRPAAEICLAAFVNLSTVMAWLANVAATRSIALVCAGTDGRVTREDVLLAGALVDRLRGPLPRHMVSDAARIACDAWLAVADTRLESALHNCQGGRNLLTLGMEPDILRAAQIDSAAVLPRWDRQSQWIVRVQPT
jgi:2-phosphosulfolactate phosphatase